MPARGVLLERWLSTICTVEKTTTYESREDLTGTKKHNDLPTVRRKSIPSRAKRGFPVLNLGFSIILGHPEVLDNGNYRALL